MNADARSIEHDSATTREVGGLMDRVAIRSRLSGIADHLHPYLVGPEGGNKLIRWLTTDRND